MPNEIEKRETTTLSAREIRANVNLLQEVMNSVMKEKVHYGVIPGCKLPSLYKAGAEKIASTFRISVKSEVENLSDGDCARFKVTCSAYSISGDFLGSSTGICSSFEEKYKWRAPSCDEEFEDTPEDRRREKWMKGYYDRTAKKANPATKKKQVRTESADIENTILQMADKRAYVSLIRKVTAASDVFTQDIEDLPVEVIISEEEANEPPEMPQPKKQQDEPTNICSGCSVGITQKVYDYSLSKYNKALCFDCQKAQK